MIYIRILHKWRNMARFQKRAFEEAEAKELCKEPHASLQRENKNCMSYTDIRTALMFMGGEGTAAGKRESPASKKT